MTDELSSLGASAGESQTIDDVVEALLELAQQFLTGCLRAAAAGVEVARQLPGGDPVEPLHFLLLSQLEEVVGLPLAAPARLPGAALLARRGGGAGAAALSCTPGRPLGAAVHARPAGGGFRMGGGGPSQTIDLLTGAPKPTQVYP